METKESTGSYIPAENPLPPPPPPLIMRDMMGNPFGQDEIPWQAAQHAELEFLRNRVKELEEENARLRRENQATIKENAEKLGTKVAFGGPVWWHPL